MKTDEMKKAVAIMNAAGLSENSSLRQLKNGTLSFLDPYLWEENEPWGTRWSYEITKTGLIYRRNNRLFDSARHFYHLNPDVETQVEKYPGDYVKMAKIAARRAISFHKYFDKVYARKHA